MEPGSAAKKGGGDGLNPQGVEKFEKKLQDQTDELAKLAPNVSVLMNPFKLPRKFEIEFLFISSLLMPGRQFGSLECI